jgi:NDP-sugar pyrophosphorylase family protein
MTNIVIPMAGLGKRFFDNGFSKPKPLIDINGCPMIKKVLDSLSINGKYIFITRKTEYSDQLNDILKNTKPNCIIHEIDYVTDGPASTVNLVRQYINNNEELIVANCDQIMWWDGEIFLYYCRNKKFDGIVVTYYCNSSKNSYAKIDKFGLISEIREKQIISNISLNGIHYWKKGCDFIESYDTMVEKNDLAPNGEFYVGPSYNHMISKGKKIGIFHIPNSQHHAVGTPDDLREYIRNENLQTK